MTQLNDTTKALVLYVPPVAEADRSARRRCFFRAVYSFYSSRSGYYYCYISLFIVISVFARCVHLNTPSVGNDIINELEVCYLNHGFTLSLIYKFLSSGIVCAVFAFLSGFTVFALPVTFLTALHLYFSASYLFFAAVDRAFELSFFGCFSYIALFALMVVISAFFFTETRLFYGRSMSAARSKKRYTLYIFLFFAYVFLHLGIMFLSFNLLFNS